MVTSVAGEKLLEVFDGAIRVQLPVAQGHINWLRGFGHAGTKEPAAGKERSPRQILRRLNAEFRAATVTTGAGVGATAAAPGVGTGVALALSTVEAASFLEASVLYVLGRAQLHDVDISDIERRRALVLAVLLGDTGVATVGKVAGRTGTHWARKLVEAVPLSSIHQINRVLGRNFVTRYGTRQGIIVLGRVVPFGIGALIGGSLNGAFSQMTIVAANRAFGHAPDVWPEEPTASLPDIPAEVVSQANTQTPAALHR